jgi:hypothetical protein
VIRRNTAVFVPTRHSSAVLAVPDGTEHDCFVGSRMAGPDIDEALTAFA